MENKKAVVRPEQCTLCGACVEACKFDALSIKRDKTVQTDTQARGVWVFCEQKRGVVQSVSYELLGKGRELADKLGCELCGILIGHDIESRSQDIIQRGADTVYIVDHPHLKHYVDDAYTTVLVRSDQKI
jgi:electron transfer flavoprotein alpha subunit